MGDHFLTAETGEVGKKWVASGNSSTGTSKLQTLCPKNKVAVQVSEMRYVHGVDQEWCRAAIDVHTFTCEGSGQIWPHENKIVLGDGRTWSQAWFEEHGEYCYRTLKSWPKSEMRQLGDVRVHRSKADNYDSEGNELPIRPKPKSIRDSRMSYVGIDFAVDHREVILRPQRQVA
jgi:hypothetical protein